MGTNSSQKVAVVTGSSSDIGFETSPVLSRNNFHTYATMRNPEKVTKSYFFVSMLALRASRRSLVGFVSLGADETNFFPLLFASISFLSS